ncbi:hypothetical protein P3584_06125 [Vibrio parahaemolyticus]|nr:hypothetical protein [Vibrio parahaemolyticus]
MNTHSAHHIELPKLNQSTTTVIKELFGIVTLFAVVAVPTLLLALHWSA